MTVFAIGWSDLRGRLVISATACFLAAAFAPVHAQSRDALFGDDAPAKSEAPTIAWHGYVRGELAYTYGEPDHWSKMLVRAELEGQGALTDRIKYKIGARLDYDFVYDVREGSTPTAA